MTTWLHLYILSIIHDVEIQAELCVSSIWRVHEQPVAISTRRVWYLSPCMVPAGRPFAGQGRCIALWTRTRYARTSQKIYVYHVPLWAHGCRTKTKARKYYPQRRAHELEYCGRFGCPHSACDPSKHGTRAATHEQVFLLLWNYRRR
jgi:hypothetical protein